MSNLTPEQIKHLSQLMDERWTCEIAKINAVANRSRDERRQEAIAGRAADRLDEALAEIALSTDYAMREDGKVVYWHSDREIISKATSWAPLDRFRLHFHDCPNMQPDWSGPW